MKHLEAIVCRCQSASRCMRAGQQHFMPLEQLGGMENECVFPSFVSYKTPRENSHLEPIFLSLLALTCLDGGRNSPYASFQLRRKFVLPCHRYSGLGVFLQAFVHLPTVFFSGTVLLEVLTWCDPSTVRSLAQEYTETLIYNHDIQFASQMELKVYTKFFTYHFQNISGNCFSD